MEEENKANVEKQELPSPEELIPSSQVNKAEELSSPEKLIPPSQVNVEEDLIPDPASTFGIPTFINPTLFPKPQSSSIASIPNYRSIARTDFDSGDLNRGELVRIRKKRRIVWSPELHKKFLEALADLGLENATGEAITEKMNVDGLSSDCVSSHLLKYKLLMERKSVKEKVVSAGDFTMNRLLTNMASVQMERGEKGCMDIKELFASLNCKD